MSRVKFAHVPERIHFCAATAPRLFWASFANISRRVPSTLFPWGSYGCYSSREPTKNWCHLGVIRYTPTQSGARKQMGGACSEAFASVLCKWNAPLCRPEKSLTSACVRGNLVYPCSGEAHASPFCTSRWRSSLRGFGWCRYGCVIGGRDRF